LWAHFFKIKAYQAPSLPKFPPNLPKIPLSCLKQKVCTSTLGAIF